MSASIKRCCLAIAVGIEHRDATSGGFAFLVRQGVEAGLEHCGDTVSEEGTTPSSGTQSGGCVEAIDAADSTFHRVLLMMLYATGACRDEVAHLKVSDIDSQRMVVHIRGARAAKTVTPCSARSCLMPSAGTGAGACSRESLAASTEIDNYTLFGV